MALFDEVFGMFDRNIGKNAVAEVEDVAFAAHDFLDGLDALGRITSYNVCYTKLLREAAADGRAALSP